jgi:hypothetical protein
MFTGRIISALQQAAQFNLTDPLRNGQMLCFPGAGDLFVAGDLHNHTRNFERFLKAAALQKNPDRHILLQELIHGGPLGPEGEDSSFEMLLQAIELQRQFPGRVHFLLANHDMAQVQGQAIMKDGYDLTDRFTRYFKLRFKSDAPAVGSAFTNFVYSMPLAAITVTGIFLSHSLPAPRDLPTFDPTVLRRAITAADYARNGPVFQLIWGRHQDQQVLDVLSRAWWADIFVCGHQSFDEGSRTIGDRLLIIDSSHNHGVFLPIDLGRQYTFSDLAASVTPLASIG